LTLERFSDTNDVYILAVSGLPRQVSYDFTDTETNARLSQIRFAQGVNTKRIALRVYLPDRKDDDVIIDQPLAFTALALSKVEQDRLAGTDLATLSRAELEGIRAGKARLELLPRGVGRIEVRATTLYHEITLGDSVAMNITVRNSGSRRLDNIRITTDNPLHWRSTVTPDLIRSLDPEREETVRLVFLPPSDAGVGAQEVKIRTEAMANNRAVQTEDKTVRIQVQAKTPLLWTAMLVMLLIGLVTGIVVFGIKISRR
ncbi:MAG: COG1470 family protein, partial [Candidatus Latescibacterota bacterium]